MTTAAAAVLSARSVNVNVVVVVVVSDVASVETAEIQTNNQTLKNRMVVNCSFYTKAVLVHLAG